MVVVSVHFSVLGPICARTNDREIALGTPQQCAVLALLLLGREGPMTVGSLVSKIWGDAVPATARESVRTYMCRLRRTFAAAGCTPMVKTGRAGYELPIAPEALDLSRFENLVGDARKARADGVLESAADFYREALGLWRGSPLGGVRGEFVANMRLWLDELRLVTEEERIALDLDLGRHDEVIAKLPALVATAPLRERLRELQMLALYRCSRRAESLAVYRGLCQLLDEELGIQAGREVRDLYERILNADPALDLPRRSVTSWTTVVPGAGREAVFKARDTVVAVNSAEEQRFTPYFRRNVLANRLRELRGQVFVGRGAERELFASAMAGASDSPAVLYMHGPGGIGKTTLARRLADDAVAAGRLLLQVDGSVIGSSAAAFVDAVGRARDSPGIVVVIDAFDHCQSVERWLSTKFLPELNEDALVVIAGRNKPSPAWATDPSWRGVLHIRAIGDLPPSEAQALLQNRGVVSDLRAPMVKYAGGHPLALTLVAEASDEVAGPAAALGAQQDVITTVLKVMVGETPSPAHRLALQVSANACRTTEGLLRAVMPDKDANELFGWMRGLSYIDRDEDGIYPHRVVRSSLEMDLRWRNPVRFDEIRRCVQGYSLNDLAACRITPVEATWTSSDCSKHPVTSSTL